jgi:16S rRNA A1518/A1519 N6-dimethyltransferase RsmA/KsgA/DIM1 with predicted DNA glycosylase/AP lyase activity
VFVHAVFSSRRKMLRKALTQAGFDADRILSAAGLDGRQRAEELPPEQVLELFRLHASQQATDSRRL